MRLLLSGTQKQPPLLVPWDERWVQGFAGLGMQDVSKSSHFLAYFLTVILNSYDCEGSFVKDLLQQLMSTLTVGNDLESLGLRVASPGRKHAFCDEKVLHLRFQRMPWSLQLLDHRIHTQQLPFFACTLNLP